MHIVTQSAFVSYSLAPSRPLLSAPPAPQLLCAPKIAGLLPAHVGTDMRVRPVRVEIIKPATRSLDEFLATLGPIRSREEMNAELLALLRTPREFRP